MSTPNNITYRYAITTDPYLAAARAYALQHSDDYRRPTGAAIVDANGYVLALGANQSGLGHNVLSRTHARWCLRRRTPSGRAYWRCPACVGTSGHAEARAAKESYRRHGRLPSLTCYLWGHSYACDPCITALMDIGVTSIVLESDL